ncbi:MAG: flippase-like domain-containing protein [Candidatus Rokubacteria bacterium]|nr:flippase-like domain-containing protein [Candidatus Rokubacteria bacterium]
MKTVRLALLALGAAFVGYLIVEVGPDMLLTSIRTLSWRLLVVLVFPFGVVTVLDTLGWRFAFHRDRASFLTLYPVRLAGEAFNVATPTASVGGEPVKAYLLRPRVPFEEGLASVIVDKTTITLAQGCFLVLGLGLAWVLFSLPSAFLHGMTGLLVIETLALGGFVIVQRRGIFGGGLKLLTGLGLAWGERHADKLHGLDRALAAFYRERRGRLCVSLLCHFLGWILGSLEAYLILYFLGIPISLTTAFVIEAFVAAVKFAAFLIPAGLGALEGGNVAVFAALGLGAGLGLSFALVRRLRELTWVTAGLIVLAFLRSSLTSELAA